MSQIPQSVRWYDGNAAGLAAAYETLDPSLVNSWLVKVLPPPPALILDVGAGAGRDAAWLARLGHDVVAVEPSAGMRQEGERRHSDVGFRWVADRLPALSATHRLGITFDVILLSGVWQHVAPTERERAMRKLLGLLRAGGILALTFPHGMADPNRGTH